MLMNLLSEADISAIFQFIKFQSVTLCNLMKCIFNINENLSNVTHIHTIIQILLSKRDLVAFIFIKVYCYKNQRTNGPVNAHLRSAAYTNKHV